MRGIIYKATCNHDGRVYIGQTIAGLKARRKQHEVSAKRESDRNAFHLALFQYNFDFTWEVIDEFMGSREYVAHALNVAEEFHILKYRSTDERYGFNSTAGGYSSDKFADRLKVSQVVLGGSAPKGYWQYDLDGNFIREFRSIREIAAHFNLARIRGDCLNEDGQWHGYQWRRKRMCKPWPNIGKYGGKIPHARPLLQYSLSGEYIATFASIAEAQRSSGDGIFLINAMCNGEATKKRPKYQWRFYTDDFPQNIGPIVLKPKKGDMRKPKIGRRGRPRKNTHTPGQLSMF